MKPVRPGCTSAALAAVVLLLASATAAAQRPPMVVPRDADEVIGRLPAGYARLRQPGGTRGAPVADVDAATRLLQAAARTGDARLASRAGTLLGRIPVADQRPKVLAARAFAAQHDHDFDTALRWLDAWIQADPRSAQARLARAQVRLVTGDLQRAAPDCQALAFGVDVRSGLLCTAAMALRRGQYAQAESLLARWLEQGSPADPLRGQALLLRAEAAAGARQPSADTRFREALAPDPDDVRVLAAYARYLRASGQSQRVEALLAPRVDHDGLQLQRALAAHAAGAGNADALAAAQGRRYAQARAAGAPIELRDEAEYRLVLRGDARAALALALRNFETQRDAEDVDLLLRAAAVAGDERALVEARRWAAAQGLALPAPGVGTAR